MLYMTKSKQYKFDNKGDTIVEDSTYFCGTTQRNEAKTKLESSMRVFSPHSSRELSAIIPIQMWLLCDYQVFRKCWFTDKAVVSVL